MIDNKLAILIVSVFLLGAVIGFPFGFTFNDSLQMRSELGGANVRTESTGIEITSGDSIAIGTSSPDHELEIYDTATGTLKIYGSTGCIQLEEEDGSTGYFKSVSGSLTGSTTDICN